MAVVEEALARVERYDGVLNAIVTLNPHVLDDARDLERRIARGEDPGPLAGVPVGIKDVTPVAGLRTTYGSPLYADHVADHDDLLVERIRAAGAVFVGKTNVPTMAAGPQTDNPLFGRTVNPWDLGRTPGCDWPGTTSADRKSVV